MSSSVTATTAGSAMARDVGVLCAAFPTDGKWNNTWTIMREYNRSAGNNTGPPPFAATWTEMEKSFTPTFQQTEVNTSYKSPLAPIPEAEAVKRFNHAVKLMVIFERNSISAQCQAVKNWFAQNQHLGGRSFLETAFLRRAFDEYHTTVIDLTGKTYDNFFCTWAELEVDEKYNAPVFPMDQGMTHAASPIVTGDWSIDNYTQAKFDWLAANRPTAPDSMRQPGRGGHGWG